MTSTCPSSSWKVFDVPRFDWEHNSGIMVVVEAESRRVALLVDELLGQQQVVVKNLETNYRKVNDVSAPRSWETAVWP